MAQQGTNVTGGSLLSFDQLTGTSAEQADAKEVLFNFMAPFARIPPFAAGRKISGSRY